MPSGSIGAIADSECWSRPEPVALDAPGRRVVTRRRVLVAGQSLAVACMGAGRPVLLLHGIPTSSLLWRHVQPRLGAHGRTIAVDLLGYGDSDKPGSPLPTLPVQVELLHELLHLWQLWDVLVIGHDIGGGVAQLLALRAPHRVTGLVLIDSIAYDSFPEPTIARLNDPLWDQRIQQIDLAAGFRHSFAKGVANLQQTAIDDIANLYAAPFEGTDGRAAYLRAARALHTEDLAHAMQQVEALTIPIHLIWGRDDPFQPLRFGRKLACALPNAELTVVAGGRHFLPEDHPGALGDLLVRILQGGAGHGR